MNPQSNKSEFSKELKKRLKRYQSMPRLFRVGKDFVRSRRVFFPNSGKWG